MADDECETRFLGNSDCDFAPSWSKTGYVILYMIVFAVADYLFFAVSRKYFERFSQYNTRQKLLDRVDDIPWNEPDQQKDDDTQDKEGWDDQQCPPDEIGSHLTLLISRKLSPLLPRTHFCKGGQGRFQRL